MQIKVTPDTIKAWDNIAPIDYGVTINRRLVQRQGLNRKDVGIVFQKHGEKIELFNEARRMLLDFSAKQFISEKDQEAIEDINNELAELEFAAQRAWKFDENENFHNWWMDMPGCECPRMDNHERMGVAGFIHSGGCPWHGGFDTTRDKI